MAGCALVKNAALHRALRRKDNEMNQLILMVRLCWQHTYQPYVLSKGHGALIVCASSSQTGWKDNGGSWQLFVQSDRVLKCIVLCAGLQPAGEPAGCSALFARAHRAPRVRCVIFCSPRPHPAGQHRVLRGTERHQGHLLLRRRHAHQEGRSRRLLGQGLQLQKSPFRH